MLNTWCRVGALVVAAGLLSPSIAQEPRPSGTTPPERPRSRPPSQLTGWADWEQAEDLLRRIKIPPAPALSPDEALKTFRLAPGYRLELVAAEPMVNSPIFFEFDADGRIWVVEYQGYMRDLQGTGEADPICRIVVLEDTNADGRADRSTVFLDGLVMPRSLSFVRGGVLVAEPPNLWFCPDTDGDLRCDRKVRVGTYGQAGNPQHTANGLRYGIDNWLHSADIPKKHRFVDERLIEADTIHRGQFGVTFDDEGRFLTSRENRPLIGDLIPADYLLRNPSLVKAYARGGARQSSFGVNVNLAENAQTIFPARVTPAITLGALELREDGRLRTYTVVAGNGVYNGHQFPDEAYGNVFVPDSGGHLIGRLKLTGDVELQASRVYPDEQEFLTSTDERFRPVNTRVGPDGALYIADMYHGIIEHVIFMVPYIEKQIRERRLDEDPDRGRIYRVVYEGNPIDRTPPRLSGAASGDLVRHLSHRSGWWRLTAQRLLVERRDDRAVGPLRELLRSGAAPLGRLHALWTLHGMDALDWRAVQPALRDGDDRVRAAAVRLSESLRGTVPAESIMSELERLAADTSSRVRLQVALSAGAFEGPRAQRLLLRAARENPHRLFRAAVLSGLHGRELDFLEEWLAATQDGGSADHHLELARLLAELVVHEGQPGRIERAFALTDRQPSALTRRAVLEGMAAGLPRMPLAEPIMLGAEPQALVRAASSEDESIRQAAYRLHAFFTWPGAPALRAGVADVEPLSADEMRLAERGKSTYDRACAACHQVDGGGLAGVAPRLAGSDWIARPPEHVIRIVLHGLYGPIQVDGDEWNLHMPGLGGALDDEEVAAVLTYVRRAWGNRAGAVRPDDVASARARTAGRTIAWTARELLAEAGDGAPSAARVRPGADGVLHLPAKMAITYGRELAYRPSLDILAPWRHEHDIAEWHVDVPEDGEYEVRVTLAADDASSGDRFTIATDDSQTSGEVRASGGYATFHEYAVGVLRLRAGANRVVMRPDGALQRELADVRGLRLVPRRAGASK